MILTPSRQAEEAGNLDIAMKNKYPYFEMAGWGATGVFIRAMALPMQLKPMFYRPHIHLGVFIAFAGFGYVMHNWEVKRMNRLEEQKDLLVRKRMMRQKEREEREQIQQK